VFGGNSLVTFHTTIPRRFPPERRRFLFSSSPNRRSVEFFEVVLGNSTILDSSFFRCGVNRAAEKNPG
jgi:hypothetical protein